ncbi:hypothetical protein Tco_0118745, partial [Tanacetum coccineum]
ADRQTENKRKQDNNQQPQQQHQNKRQNSGRAYAAGTVEKKQYGPYALNAIITTMVHVLINATNATKLAILPVTIGVRKMPIMLTIRRVLGHFKRECPKLKNNNNRGNQVGGGNAPAKVYAVGHVGTNPDSNVVMVSRVECLLEDRPKAGLSLTEGSRRRHSEDRF